jgi:RNA polymerase sigma-70 factor, ECF subfamily
MDDDLIQRARKGDRQAMADLHERYASRVYSVVRRIAGDDALADDLAQEAWLRVFRTIRDFRSEAGFGTWLHRVAVNTALSDARKVRRERLRLLEVANLQESSDRPERPLLRLTLEQAIDTLPDGMRRILVLHDIEGYTHREIAATLGINDGTCKSQLFKARARLRLVLAPATRGEGERICIT